MILNAKSKSGLEPRPKFRSLECPTSFIPCFRRSASLSLELNQASLPWSEWERTALSSTKFSMKQRLYWKSDTYNACMILTLTSCPTILWNRPVPWVQWWTCPWLQIINSSTTGARHLNGWWITYTIFKPEFPSCKTVEIVWLYPKSLSCVYPTCVYNTFNRLARSRRQPHKGHKALQIIQQEYSACRCFLQCLKYLPRAVDLLYSKAWCSAKHGGIHYLQSMLMQSIEIWKQ